MKLSKIIRKSAALLLAGAMAVSVCGCNGSEGGNSGKEPVLAENPDNGTARDLTIMSLNMLTTGKYEATAKDPDTKVSRIEKVIALLNEHTPDSIGLQEVTTKWETALQNKIMASTDKEYNITGLKSSEGLDLRSGSNEYSPILYRSDLYTIVDEGGGWYSDTPDVKSKYGDTTDEKGKTHTGMYFERVYSYAVFKDNSTNEIAYIHINTHFDHKSDDYVNTLCSEQILEVANSLKKDYPGVAIFMTGDFNTPENSNAYNKIVAEGSGFADTKYLGNTYDKTGTVLGYGGDFNANIKTKIDHIFGTSNNVSTYEFRVLPDAFLSDHEAVKSRVRINETPHLLGVSLNDVFVADFDPLVHYIKATSEDEHVKFTLYTEPGYTIEIPGETVTDLGNGVFEYDGMPDNAKMYSFECVVKTGAGSEWKYEIHITHKIDLRK